MKKRYAQVGVGGRARFFYEAIAGTYQETAELVGFCDVNQIRMNYANEVIQEKYGVGPVPTYRNDQFDEMIQTEKPDVVIVTSIDRTHHKYIIRAMELGCDVISEKPMTTDDEKAQAIIDAIRRTGRKLRVTFNYRYAPHNTKIRELIMDGAIGDIYSVHFEWLLNTQHGADYFRRWHRDKRNSGGLLVHKATHHFDLVNFWLGTQPKTVYAMGDLRFYGRENAENRGVTRFYTRAHGSENAKDDYFALNMEESEQLKRLYLEAEKEDGYIRDQSVFGDSISIEDTMGVMVRYRNKAIMTYSLNAYKPWEGYRVAFNGSKGRIQVLIAENTYVNAGGAKEVEGSAKKMSIAVFPMFGEPYEVDIPMGTGGHGGGDPVLLNDLFGVPQPDRFNRAASHVDGAMSILTGVAANKSIATGLPIDIDRLVRFD
ncbi:MAG: Gfo/Idh/MocA family oxidoreductase [Ruminococcaceae bacterium]|nr:Gfo/Idh/MocA family oxidoreductase [Oscillospiraceae bacterium]